MPHPLLNGVWHLPAEQNQKAKSQLTSCLLDQGDINYENILSSSVSIAGL